MANKCRYNNILYVEKHTLSSLFGMGKDTAHAKYYIISSKVHETALAGQAEN
jgi:hypothetical protein